MTELHQKQPAGDAPSKAGPLERSTGARRLPVGCWLGLVSLVVAIPISLVIGPMPEEANRARIGTELSLSVFVEFKPLSGHFRARDFSALIVNTTAEPIEVEVLKTEGGIPWGDTITPGDNSGDHRQSTGHIDFDVKIRVPDEPRLIGQVGHIRLEGKVDHPSLDALGRGFTNKTIPVVEEREFLFVAAADDVRPPVSATRRISARALALMLLLGIVGILQLLVRRIRGWS